MSNEVKLVFAGDSSRLSKSFDDVGASSTRMVGKINEQSDSHTRLGERIGSNEQRFMGTADLLDGLGATFGLPTEGATALARGLGDLSGGFEIVSGILPALSGMFPKLAGAMTFVSSHPLLLAVMAGGAIIAGLILLEKKFGLVSAAVEGLGNVFGWVWDKAIKPALNFILGGIEKWMNVISAPLRLFSKLPGVPDLPEVKLPRLDVGGTVLQTGIAVVHRGEVVQPAGGGLAGGGAGGLNITVNVYGSVTAERDLAGHIHAALLRKQTRTGNLGFRAA